MELAKHVLHYLGTHKILEKEIVVIGLPRGGVPTADEVAQALGCTLDIIVPR